MLTEGTISKSIRIQIEYRISTCVKIPIPPPIQPNRITLHKPPCLRLIIPIAELGQLGGLIINPARVLERLEAGVTVTEYITPSIVFDFLHDGMGFNINQHQYRADVIGDVTVFV